MNTQFNEKRFLDITRIMSVLSKILMIITLIGLGAIVIGFIAILFIPSETLTIDLSSLDQITFTALNINFDLSVDYFSGTYNIKNLILLIMLSGGIALGFFFYFINLLYKVLNDVNQKMPFSTKNIKRLYYMSYSFILMAFIIPIFMFITGWELIHVLNIDATVNYSIDTNMFFIGVLVWILASIFNYGNYLQEEVDQTV